MRAPILGDQPVTVSIGVAELHPGEDTKDWMKRVDEALYSAKKGGRNRVVAAESSTPRSHLAAVPRARPRLLVSLSWVVSPMAAPGGGVASAPLLLGRRAHEASFGSRPPLRVRASRRARIRRAQCAAKAQLAPNGKLRFAFTVNNPNYATQPRARS
jgi:hypothetical protein